MAVDNIVRSYGDVSRKDSVRGLVEILTATEAWFLNNLEKTKATDGIHVSFTDTLRTAAALSVEEAADYTYLARTTPSRITNVVEMIAAPVKVALFQTWIQKWTEDELARQTAKALMDWGNAAEFDLVRATLVSGVSGTAASMDGIITAISRAANTTVHTSGTALSASILRGLLQTNWDNNNGNVATDIFMESFLKSVVDTFVGKNTSYVFANEARIVDAVNVYETGFGALRLHAHRYVRQSTDFTGRILAIRPEKLAIAYLKEPFIDRNLSITGPFVPFVVLGALTLEVRDRFANFFASGFDDGSA